MLGFRDLTLPPNPLKNFRCVRMRGRVDLVPEISVSGLEILLYEHFSPVTGMNSGGPDGIVLHCLLYFPYHNISILFNCSDTALGVAEAMMIGAKVKFFVFCHFCFVPQI